MLRPLPIALLLLASSLAACASEEGYTPISDPEGEDNVCSTANLIFSSPFERVQYDLSEVSGEQVHEGTLSMYEGSTGYYVNTEEIILSIGEDAAESLRISIDSPYYDVLTKMEFWVDYRMKGDADNWERLDINPASATNGWWFHSLEIDLSQEFTVNRVATMGAALTNCDVAEQEYDEPIAFPFQGKDVELRLRAYPKTGLGSLEGDYNYTLRIDAETGK